MKLTMKESNKQVGIRIQPALKAQGYAPRSHRSQLCLSNKDRVSTLPTLAFIWVTYTLLLDLIKRAQEVTALIKKRNYLVEILVMDDADEQSRRVSGKVDRALEKMRRAAIAMLDLSTTKPLDERQECVHVLLEELVNTFDVSLRQVSPVL